MFSRVKEEKSLELEMRRRDYRIHSLFHEVPPLSPVPEVEESASSRFTPPTRSESPSRPFSPLPDLIIEVQPKLNPIDHPKAFYEKLYKKVIKIYRKLIVEGRNISSVSNYDSSDSRGDLTDVGSEEYHDEHEEHKQPSLIADSNDEEHGEHVTQDSTEDEDIEEIILNTENIQNQENIIRKRSRDAPSESESLSSKRSRDSGTYVIPNSSIDTEIDFNEGMEEDNIEEGNDEQASVEQHERTEEEVIDQLNIIVQAQIHRDAEPNDDLLQSEENYQSTDNLNDTNSQNHDVVLEDNGEILATVPHGGNENLQRNSNDENLITVMETDNKILDENEGPENTDSFPEAMRTAGHRESNNSILDLIRESDHLELSEPNMKTMAREISFESLLENTSDSNVSVADAATQTSYCLTNSDILKDIFVGYPVVFRLCRCSDHVCK